MSFVMMYQVPRSKSNRYFSLMGVVGQDSQLYWSTSDVLHLAPSSEGIHPLFSSVRVRDVVGIAAARLGEKPFLRKRVLTHLQTCKALRKARRKSVRRFGKRLNCPQTWVHEVVRGGVDPAAPWQEPSLIRMLEKKEVDIEKHNFFCVWYTCFRQRAAEAVYGLNLVNGLSLPELFGGDEEEAKEVEKEEDEAEKQEFVFPVSILLKHGEETVRYVREPE